MTGADDYVRILSNEKEDWSTYLLPRDLQVEVGIISQGRYTFG